MPNSKIDNLTLHEKFSDLEHLSRDMIQHLEKGFLPKAHKLTKLLRKKEQELEDLKDITVRNQVNVLLESEKYTDQLFQKISDYCESIAQAVKEIEQSQ